LKKVSAWFQPVKFLIKNFCSYGMVVVFFLIFIGWFYLIPKAKEVLEAKNTLEQQEKRLIGLRAKLADLESLDETGLQERFDSSLKAIPEKKVPVSVMTILREEALGKGLLVDSLSVSPGGISATASAHSALDKISFKTQISGSLNGVLDFLKEVSSFLPLMAVRQIAITLNNEIANTSLVIESYSLPLPTTLGSLDSPVSKLTPEEEKTLREISQFRYFPSSSFAPSGGRANPFSF